MVEGTELLTVRQVADELQVSAWTVRKWISDGMLGHTWLGYRTVRVGRDDLHRFLADRKDANGNGR